MKKFDNKIVLVTGSTRGIGKAIAQAFAQEGATVIITGRDEAVVRAAVQEIQKNSLKADGYACNVAKLENVTETVNKILDKHSRIDILINNAGVTKDNLLVRMTESDWQEVISVNLGGVFNFTKAVTKAMLKEKKGKIINITSIIGITGNSGQANYAASKAGIIGFTKSMARELASRGINVNAVAPGYIETDMTAQLKEQVRESILQKIPLGRLGTAQDVAGVCQFLASPEADYITGQTIVVDGGMAI